MTTQQHTRDRATDPRLGDQTACRHCTADIEYNEGWHDRGRNVRCAESGMAKWDQDGVPIPFPAEQPHEACSDLPGGVVDEPTELAPFPEDMACPHCGGGIRLCEGGYVRTWSLSRQDDDGNLDDGGMLIATDQLTDYEGGDCKYWSECGTCLTRFAAPTEDWEWS